VGKLLRVAQLSHGGSSASQVTIVEEENVVGDINCCVKKVKCASSQSNRDVWIYYTLK